MLHIALIPILGVLLLLAMTVYVQYRRSAKVAALRQSVEKQVLAIVRGDAANDQTLVENIIRGLGIDQALQHFQTTRAGLLPGGSTDAPANWSTEQLETWKSKAIKRGIESVNRGLMLPAFFSFIVIVAVCVVATTVLYSFQSSGDGAVAAPVSSPALAPVPFDPAPLSPVVQPPPVPAADDAAADPLSGGTDANTGPAAPVDDPTGAVEESGDPMSPAEKGLQA